MKGAIYSIPALADHSFKTDHEIEWDNVSIITCNPCYFQRICLEAWHINNAKDPLNRDDGNLFPEAYRHLIINRHNSTGTINTSVFYRYFTWFSSQISSYHHV